MIDLDLDSTATASLPLQAAPDGERAQAIDCGGLRVAVPYQWARQIVDHFELSPVPNAPIWLAGAANVEGRCLPVVDLALWLNPQEAPSTALRNRLLVGGEGDTAVALRFQGLPAMVRAHPAPARTDALQRAVPQRLLPFVVGQAAEGGSAVLPLLDLSALAKTWAEEIAL